MAARAARWPTGKVSVVFDRDKDREGAYDFLESPHVEASAMTESMCRATAERARGARSAYVIVDGSSLTLTDERETKGFGPVGSPNFPARGLMVMNALAVAKNGTPLGLIDQQFWAREEVALMTHSERVERNRDRDFEDKYGYRFVQAAENAGRRLVQVGVEPWVVIDREGDNGDVLMWLSTAVWAFTIRAKWDRRLGPGESCEHIRESLLAERSLCTQRVEIARSGQRAARTAVVSLRVKEVQISIPRRGATPTRRLSLHAVLVQELASKRDDRLDWLLLTNVPINSAEDATKVVDSYRSRWRIEEFHRTWKRGQCNVEEAQLRSPEAMMKWATILAAVANRIERLKYLARTEPTTPASVELEPIEIEALNVAHRARDRERGLTVRVPRVERVPTIAEAVEWIADLGGWLGEKRSGRPGSLTLARGLDHLAIYTKALVDFRRETAEGKRRT
jgi:hypothetical protein